MRIFVLSRKGKGQIAREYKRAKVVLMVRQNHKMIKVSRLPGVSYSMVKKCMVHYRRAGISSFIYQKKNGYQEESIVIM
jgi:transposase